MIFANVAAVRFIKKFSVQTFQSNTNRIYLHGFDSKIRFETSNKF